MTGLSIQFLNIRRMFYPDFIRFFNILQYLFRLFRWSDNLFKLYREIPQLSNQFVLISVSSKVVLLIFQSILSM